MKILHLIDIPWWSGLTSYAFDTIQSHQKQGSQVTLALNKNSLAYKKAKNINCSLIPIRGRKPLDSFSNFFLIGVKVIINKPNWIVAHTGSTHWIAVILGIIFGIPVIRVRAISQKLKTHWINKIIYQKSAAIVTASENLQSECLNLISTNYKNKIRAIYPAAGEEFITFKKHEPAPRKELKKKIGIVARLDPVKGHSNFLKAAKIVQASCPEIEFHVVGSEENISWSSLLLQSKTLGLKNLFYHGFLDSKNLVQFMNECSMGVIASIGSEEVSRSLIEWMSQGKAVVATNVGSIPEILKEGEGGYLVQPNEPLKMAEKIIQLFKNQNLLIKMGQFNLDLCKKQFNQERFGQEWKNLLKTIF